MTITDEERRLLIEFDLDEVNDLFKQMKEFIGIIIGMI